MKSATHDRSRRHVVQSEDGVSLAVREYGPVDAPVTAVFVHGHCLHTHSWARLRSRLTREWG
ncbi:hypothetical protein ACWGSU_33825, partial [Streptomyces koyangensis]